METKIFVSQKAFIRRNKEVLILRDPDYVVDGQIGLDFPGGRYRWGQDPTQELSREVQEETGLTIKIGKPFHVFANFKHGRLNKNRIYLVAFICDYVAGEVKLSDEHDKFEWVDKKTYRNWQEDSEYFKALESYFELNFDEGT